MAEDDIKHGNGPELGQRKWKGIIASIDAQIPSPEQRVSTVKDILAPHLLEYNISNWDMVCFCLAFLVTQFTEYTYITKLLRELNKYVYQMHYQQSKEIGLIK